MSYFRCKLCWNQGKTKGFDKKYKLVQHLESEDPHGIAPDVITADESPYIHVMENDAGGSARSRTPPRKVWVKVVVEVEVEADATVDTLIDTVRAKATGCVRLVTHTSEPLQLERPLNTIEIGRNRNLWLVKTD